MVMDKLAQCIKMMQNLNKEKYKFLYNAGNQGELPIDNADMRYYPEFTLCIDGSVEYHGTDGKSSGALSSYYYESKKRSDVRLKNLKPTAALIDFAYSKLKNICFEQARELVLERLVQHQIKISGLDFLLGEAECNLH
jgi:hypothetical protein